MSPSSSPHSPKPLFGVRVMLPRSAAYRADTRVKLDSRAGGRLPVVGPEAELVQPPAPWATGRPASAGPGLCSIRGVSGPPSGRRRGRSRPPGHGARWPCRARATARWVPPSAGRSQEQDVAGLGVCTKARLASSLMRRSVDGGLEGEGRIGPECAGRAGGPALVVRERSLVRRSLPPPDRPASPGRSAACRRRCPGPDGLLQSQGRPAQPAAVRACSSAIIGGASQGSQFGHVQGAALHLPAGTCHRHRLPAGPAIPLGRPCRWPGSRA